LDALFFADYAQIELRLLAYYMAVLGDQSMAEAIIAGKDLHSESAIGALGLSGDPTDEQRQVGKTLNFSLVYGGGTPTIMRQLEIPFPEARKLLRNFHGRWPGIQIVINTINNEITRKGYIKTLFGRNLRPDSEHKRLNALVQGCAADLMRWALVNVDEQLKDADSHLVSVIHDELIIDSTKAELDWLVEMVPQWMRYPEVEEFVPIGVDPEVSFTNWAEKGKIERVREL
jgi:DNA polymerase I